MRRRSCPAPREPRIIASPMAAESTPPIRKPGTSAHSPYPAATAAGARNAAPKTRRMRPAIAATMMTRIEWLPGYPLTAICCVLMR